MSTAREALVKRTAVLAGVAALVTSLGFLLVACGSQRPLSTAQPSTHSSSGSWRTLPSAPVRVDAGLTGV